MTGCGETSVEDQLQQCLKNLDALLASTVMSVASMIPGFAGIAAAGATVGFDLSKRFWIGALLSGSSMIPLVGYLPGGVKIAWNIKRIDLEIQRVEGFLPEIEKHPSLRSKLEKEASKYYEGIRRIPFAKPLSSRLLRIIEFCREMPAKAD
jgi:hypothetical protein